MRIYGNFQPTESFPIRLSSSSRNGFKEAFARKLLAGVGVELDELKLNRFLVSFEVDELGCSSMGSDVTIGLE